MVINISYYSLFFLNLFKIKAIRPITAIQIITRFIEKLFVLFFNKFRVTDVAHMSYTIFTLYINMISIKIITKNRIPCNAVITINT